MNNKSLLPLNATSLLKDLENVSAKSLDLKTLNRFVNNPDKAQEKILPWIGWSVSIDSWDDNWSLEVKRQMIRSSLLLHKIKGTKGAIKRALEILGVEVKITEWWEVNPQLTPHTFQLIAYLNENFDEKKSSIITSDTQKKIVNLVNNVKPLRSHMDFKLGARFESKLFCKTNLRIKSRINLALKSKLPTFSNNLTIAAFLRVVTYRQING